MVCEISLGQRGGSSYGKGERGMKSSAPTNIQFLGPPGIGFMLSPSTSEYLVAVRNYLEYSQKKSVLDVICSVC